MLKSKIKIEEMCRTCLSKENDKLYSVFTDILGTQTLGSVISSITGIKFEPGDGLPTTVCGSCKKKATIAYDYKCRSLQADRALRNDVTVKIESNISERDLFEAGPSGVKTENESPPDPPDDHMDSEINLPGSNDGEASGSHDGEAPTDQGDGADNNTYCPVCGENYEDAAGLTSHMWRFHPDIMGPKKRGRPKRLLTGAIVKRMLETGRQVRIRRHACSLCQSEAATAEDLALHMMQHKDDKFVRCVHCRKIFVRRENFDQHNCTNRPGQQQENGMVVDGQAAGQSGRSATEVTLRELLASNDPESVLQVCFTCGGVFLSVAELNDHRDTDHPDLSLRCGHCHKVFASLRGAARHRDSCALVERLFTCDTCGAKFQHEITLNKHILRHHAGRPVSIRFNTSAPGTSGTSNAVLQCDTCNRSFRRKDLLVKHIQLHQPTDKYFECDICQKKFHRRNNLRSHMRTHEARPKPSTSRACLCLYCGHGFSNSSNLIVHMRRHTGEKPYKCDFCGKGFPRSSDLQCHRRSHTGEKPCVCVLCGKADEREDEQPDHGFSRSNKLSRHMRVHTGLKPYSCLYCDKKFSQSNDLTLHVRRHTGHKPYGCEVCGDRFIHGAALHHHQRFHNHFPDGDMMRGGHQVTVSANNESLPFSTLTLAN